MTRAVPVRLQDFKVTKDGDLVYFALLADVEPINDNGALKNEAWKYAMTKELVAIKRNNTWQLV